MKRPIVHMTDAQLFYDNRLLGTVLDHPRLGKCPSCVTSRIQRIWKNRKTVTTLNTIYKLDKPLVISQ